MKTRIYILLKGLLLLVRPKQWIKNSFVLAPLIFTSLFLDIDSVLKTLLAVMYFCVGSSSAYIVNDILDVNYDRQHLKKSKIRPIASGMITMHQAVWLLVLLYIVLILGFIQVPEVVTVIFIYILLNFSYTLIFKHIPVIDIFIIAIGFVLRVYAGAMALSVPVSSWMFITTLCLALYIAAIKRRQEILLVGNSGRKVLRYYSVELVDKYAEMSATGALIFYSMFVMSSKPEMVITIPIVMYGLFRYWFMVETLEEGESPTDSLYRDWQLIMIVLTWICTCAYLVWPYAK